MISALERLRRGDAEALPEALHHRARWLADERRGDPKAEGREAVAALLAEESAHGVTIGPRPIISHDVVLVFEVHEDGLGRQGYRVFRVVDGGLFRIEDFDDRERALERAGRMALSVPPLEDWLELVCREVGIEPNERLDGILRLIQREEVPAKYGIGRRELVASSLGALQIPAVREARSLVDVGTGYGFPGLVLATVLDADVKLIELAPERCAYLRLAIRELGLRNVEVVESPVEVWTGVPCEVATVRNVSALNTVAEWAGPTLRVGGTAVFWMQSPSPAEYADGLAAATALGLAFRENLREHTWGTWRLFVFEKVSGTPPQFPRATRAARRRPIRAQDLPPTEVSTA